MGLHYQTHDYTVSGVDYQVSISDEPIDPAWDAFVSSLPHGHHEQTSFWGQAKNVLGYHTLRVVVSEDKRILAGGQFLIRQLLPLVSIAYMSKGPILSTWDPPLIEIIINELKRAAKTNHFLVLALQTSNNHQDFNAWLESQGFKPSWLELAPTATTLIDLTQDTDQILGGMKRQTRQKIRRSTHAGITTREGTEDDLPSFNQLHGTTSKRQGFTPYPKEYFPRMWEVFSNQGLISLIIAEYQCNPVSAVLLVSYGNTVIGKAFGWSGHYAKRKPNDAVLWAAIQWAKAHGFHYFDMGGIDRKGAELILSGQPLPEPLHRTPDMFKLGYGGSPILLPQSYIFVPCLLLRWFFNLIFGLEGPGKVFKSYFERFRRLFG